MKFNDSKENEARNVSVVVSVYNKANTIERCLHSLFELEYKNKKIVIIDNYSSDGSYELLEKIQGEFDLYRKHGTYSEVLNWILYNLNTEFMALTDADCVVDKNWLSELMKGFENKDVVATAGYCGTPKEAAGFQRIIGLELESRFKRFPKYLLRAPTMSLCLRTKEAKEVGFDNNMEYVVEADFGYRLTSKGKILYVPEAKIYHYDRATIYDYYVQKKNQSADAVKTYIKHVFKLKGDHISTSTMMIQVPLGGIIYALAFLSIFKRQFFTSLEISIAALILIYIFGLISITKEVKYYPYFLLLFFVRTNAWIIGSFGGVLKLLARNLKYK